MPTLVSTGQLTIIDTNDGLNLYLTNQSHVVPTDLNGLSGNFTGCVTTAVITLGSLNDSANWAVTATPSAGVTGSLSGKTYTVTAMSNDTGYVDFSASRVGYATLTARFTLAKAKAGADGISIVLSNEAHILPAGSDGTVSNYASSGTTIAVYEGGAALTASVTATTSAFRIGTITQAPASTITVGAVSYSGATATVAQHSAMAAGTDSVTLIIPITVYRANGTSVTVKKTQTISKAKAGAVGANAVVGVLSNESHLIPTDSAGNNGNFTGAATTMFIYNGATDDSANWTVTASALIGVTGSLSGKTYTVTGMTVDTGYVDLTASRSGYSNVVKRFTLSKSKAGATGATGPAVVVNPSRSASFTSTDGVLDASQADIVFTAAVSGVASPTYTWAFSGLQTNPTASTTTSQTITAAQFGTAKSATVTCTVGTYKDTLTIVRLEKSTAAAGATVGAPTGTYVGTTPAETVVSNASDGKSAYDAVNSSTSGLATKLGKASSEILNIATSGTTYMAGLRVGDIAWDSNGARTSGKGVAITPSGILGHNGTKPTFAINATTGDASFGGALNAATGSFAGSLSAATGTFSGTLTASAVDAVNTINIAGNAVTVPVSAYSESTGTISVGTGWYDLQSAYIDTEGQPVIVIATATNGTFGMPLIWGVFDKDNMAIAQSVGDSCAITASSSKSGTFKLKVRRPSGTFTGAIMYRSLVLLGAKR